MSLKNNSVLVYFSNSTQIKLCLQPIAGNNFKREVFLRHVTLTLQLSHKILTDFHFLLFIFFLQKFRHFDIKHYNCIILNATHNKMYVLFQRQGYSYSYVVSEKLWIGLRRKLQKITDSSCDKSLIRYLLLQILIV